jgi:hypothetical protein
LKEELVISPKYTYIILSIFALIAIVGIFYLIRNSVKYNNEIELLRTKAIKGVIVELQDTGRGFCSITINERNENVTQYSLSIAWEVKEYHIQVGDSVSKELNSNLIKFYKYKDGEFIPNGSYEM